jgi:hypothetical protein
MGKGTYGCLFYLREGCDMTNIWQMYYAQCVEVERLRRALSREQLVNWLIEENAKRLCGR